MNPQPPFLPLTSAEGRACGIDQFDIILVTGDAYIDHPSFGTALIGRVLWDAGFSVGIIAQPDVKTERDFTALGRPRLFFGISSGNVDSMVNNLTPNLKRRSSDVYSPGGVPRCPDRATIVYANRVHEHIPVHRLSSGASRRACAGSRTTITGRTGCASPSLPMRRPPFLPMVWLSGRW